MSTTATGVVSDPNGGLSSLTVVLHDVSSVCDSLLKEAKVADSGAFTLSYAAQEAPGPDEGTPSPRRLRLRVRLGQHILKELTQDDVDTDPITFSASDLTLKAGEATSVLTTLGNGTASLPFYTSGNAVAWHCDNVDAWSRLAKMLRDAQKDTRKPPIYLMQLVIELNSFTPTPPNPNEAPEVILDFNPAVPTKGPFPTAAALATDDADYGRVESLLVDADKAGLKVRLQLPMPTLDAGALPAWMLAIVLDLGVAAVGAGFIIAGANTNTLWKPVLTGLGVLLLLGSAFGFFAILGAGLDRNNAAVAGLVSNWENILDWFKAASSGVIVKPFYTHGFSVTHTKLAIVDQQSAILLGSPFSQGYFDAPSHLVDQPMRGVVKQHAPIHDVSVSVRGPAVGDLQEIFNKHWNLAAPDDLLPDDPAASPATPSRPAEVDAATVSTPEYVSSVQVVRTLNNATFKDELSGEKGILESYLRAIHFAKRFIYLENQYFTKDVIRDALIDALQAGVHVIMVLNVRPDTPPYPHYQWQAIKQIRKDTAKAAGHFGVFTLWSHEPPDPTDPDHPKTKLVTNYCHAKVATIDDLWATVGSANMEGAALDRAEHPWSLDAGAHRNTETNCVVYETTSPDAPNPAAQALRRKLWGEHLALAEDDPALADPGKTASPDWPFDRWTAIANDKQSKLQSQPTVPVSARVLPWPLDMHDWLPTWTSWFPWANGLNPMGYLDALKIDTKPFDSGLLKHGPRTFDFGTSAWKSK